MIGEEFSAWAVQQPEGKRYWLMDGEAVGRRQILGLGEADGS